MEDDHRNLTELWGAALRKSTQGEPFAKALRVNKNAPLPF